MQLALINIAKARYPIKDPHMAGFVSKLDAVNAAAERSNGFVWRLVGNVSDDATSIVAFEDPTVIVNMAVWESIEALEDYTYRTIHKRVFSSRNEWFERMDGPHMALWWIKTGTIPTIEDGKYRLQLLSENGPAFEAFTFGSPYSPTGEPMITD